MATSVRPCELALLSQLNVAALTLAAMSSPALPPDLAPDDYLVVGLATCFLRQDGETTEITVVEPVPSAYLEALFQGVPTAYTVLQGTTLSQAIAGDGLPSADGAPAQLCEDFASRALAAARSYQTRAAARALVPLGECRRDVNHSTEKKRILNAEHLVSAADNVKQHAYTHQVL